MIYDLVIIGGGPAGLSAAIYAGRGGIKTLVLEGMGYGGQINYTAEVDNYPGFLGTGPELAEKMRSQAMSMGAEFSSENVKEIKNAHMEIKSVVCRKNTYQTKNILLVTGAKPRKLGLLEEDKFSGSGVSYCATCDGAFFKGQQTAVVGGGNTAFEDAIYLSRFCTKVYLIHRSQKFKANAHLVSAAMQNPKIEILTDYTVSKIQGDTTVKNIVLQHTLSDRIKMIEISGLFIAIGRVPQTALVRDIVNTDESGAVITDRYMQTSQKGIYAAGDVRQTPLRQIVTAVSDGAVAVTDIIANL